MIKDEFCIQRNVFSEGMIYNLKSFWHETPSTYTAGDDDNGDEIDDTPNDEQFGNQLITMHT